MSNRAILEFYAHGKLLLTGEYMVIYGAEALAIPVKFGQRMRVIPFEESSYLRWQSKILDKPWFDASFSLPDLELTSASDNTKALYLQKALKLCRSLNLAFLNNSSGFYIETNLDYPQEWGLGSSATFITNLAGWAGINPFDLHFALSKGSGYDIACAQAKGPVIYKLEGRKPAWKEVTFSPAFREHLFFVYLGTKQDTAANIEYLFSRVQPRDDSVNYISVLTSRFLNARDLKECMRIMTEHERFIGETTHQEPIRKQQFADFPGCIKSLGAWGGDFMLAASEIPETEMKHYFNRHNLFTIFRFDELVEYHC